MNKLLRMYLYPQQNETCYLGLKHSRVAVKSNMNANTNPLFRKSKSNRLIFQNCCIEAPLMFVFS